MPPAVTPLPLLLLLLLLGGGVRGQDPTTAAPTPGPGGPPGHGEEALTRAIDRGMRPVYTMANFLLETVISPPSIAALHEWVDLSDWGAVTHSLRADWARWLRHHAAYLACAVCGAAWALAAVAAGVTVCCCRARGRCGGSRGSRARPPRKAMDGEHTGHKRRGCAAAMFALLVPAMLGVTAMFLANQLVYEQTLPSGLPHTLTESLHSLADYQARTVTALEQDVGADFTRAMAAVVYELGSLPGRCQQLVWDNSTAGPVLGALQAYTGGLNGTLASLTAIDSLSENLNGRATALAGLVVELQDNVTADLAPCNTTVCALVLQQVANLSVQVYYTQALALMSEATVALTNVTTGDQTVYDGLSEALAQFDTVSLFVNASLAEEIAGLVDTAGELSSEVQAFINVTSVQLRSVSPSDAQHFVNDTMEPWLEHAGNIRYFTSIAVGCVVVILIVLFLVALSYGVCGERADKDAECCNRGNSASLLVTAAYLVFGVSWVLVLATSVLLVVGGVAHTDLCRHMVRMDDPEVLRVFDDIVSANLGLNISATQTYLHCQEDQAIYTAADLEAWGPQYNVSYLLDLDMYDIPDRLAELTQVNFTVGEIILLNDILQTNLLILDDGLQTINFSIHREQMDKEVTSISLDELSALLNESASDSGPFSDILLYYSHKTKQLQDDHVNPITQLQSSLATEIASVEQHRDSEDLGQLATDLQSAQTAIDSAAIEAAVTQVSQDILAKLQALAARAEQQVRHEVGPCEPVYHAGAEAVTAACVRLLYPFNAFWFSLGWCLFFLIFPVPMALVLAGYYERTQKYSKLAAAGIYFDPAEPDVPRRQSVHRKKKGKGPVAPPPRPGPADLELQAANHYARSPLEATNGLASLNQGYAGDEQDDGGFVDYHTQPRHERQLSTRQRDNQPHHGNNNPPRSSRDSYHNANNYEQRSRPSDDHVYDAPVPTGEGPAPYERYDSQDSHHIHYDNPAFSMRPPVPQMVQRIEQRSREPGFLNSAYF